MSGNEIQLPDKTFLEIQSELITTQFYNFLSNTGDIKFFEYIPVDKINFIPELIQNPKNRKESYYYNTEAKNKINYVILQSKNITNI